MTGCLGTNAEAAAPHYFNIVAEPAFKTVDTSSVQEMWCERCGALLEMRPHVTPVVYLPDVRGPK